PLEMPRAAAVRDSGGFAPTQPYVSGFPATEPYEAGADLQALREVFAKSMPAPVDAIDPASIALWREARRVNAAEAPATAAPVAVPQRVPMPPVARFVSSEVSALPQSVELRPRAPIQPDPAPAPASDDVLVVDAGDMSRRTLELYLQEHGFRPSLVRSGVEARDQLATHSYRLVFVNEPVAGASVFRVCRAVRRQANADGSRPTVVLVLSSRRGWWDRWRARLAGCDVCLVRPFSHEVLGRVLTRFAVTLNRA
ncbi:MAG: response regulator transcription factor, partial [Rhodoferax sp.]